jgi:hypothetical protein
LIGISNLWFDAGRNRPGTDVVIFEIFPPKNSAKKLAFLTNKQSFFVQNFDHNIGVLEKRQFCP